MADDKNNRDGEKNSLIETLWSDDGWKDLKLGRYKLKSLLGRGAMGRVFLAMDIILQRQVALKVIPAETGDDAATEQLRLFIREAQSVAGLQHPNVVSVYDVVHHEGVVAVAMEYVAGGTLMDLVGRGKTLPVREICRIVAAAAEGLAVAHEKGMVHRDIKPANLMLTGKRECKVVDFGIVRVAGEDDSSFDGKIVGTPFYVSPEVIVGREPGPAADIYALGIILWTALAGAPPFDAKENRKLYIKHVKAPVPDIDDFCGNVPIELKQLIERCLEKNPEKRLSSCAELARRLRDIARRQEELDNSELARVSAAIGRTGGAAAAGTRVADRAEPSPAAKKKQKKMAVIVGASAAGLLVLVGIIVLAVSATGPDDGGKEPDRAGKRPSALTGRDPSPDPSNNGYYEPAEPMEFTEAGESPEPVESVESSAPPEETVPAFSPSVPVAVAGKGFIVDTLRSGAAVYADGTGDATFTKVPGQIEGWRYTRPAASGGCEPVVIPAKTGVISAALVNNTPAPPDPWQRVELDGFTSTLGTVSLYRTHCSRGEEIALPPGGRALILSPRMTVVSGDGRYRASSRGLASAFDDLDAEDDPEKSSPDGATRFTWPPARGGETEQWLEWRLGKTAALSSIGVFWYENEQAAVPCRLPAQWRVAYRAGTAWRDVAVNEDSAGETEPDRCNVVRFREVRTDAVRVYAKLARGAAAGVLRLRKNLPVIPDDPWRHPAFGGNTWAVSSGDAEASLDRLNNPGLPRRSAQEEGAFSWAGRAGTTESIARVFDMKVRVDATRVYWFDDTVTCRTPASWKLFYRADGEWKEVDLAPGAACGVEKDWYNTVEFSPVLTDGLKIEAVPGEGFSAGLLRWHVRAVLDKK